MLVEHNREVGGNDPFVASHVICKVSACVNYCRVSEVWPRAGTGPGCPTSKPDSLAFPES